MYLKIYSNQVCSLRCNMRNKKNKHLGIEIEPELHYKLHYIAKYEGRSGNGQILHLIRQCIRDFESKQGVIAYEEATNADTTG